MNNKHSRQEKDDSVMTSPTSSARADRLRDAERLFCEAAELAGPRLSQVARVERLRTIKETAHLQKVFRAALEELASKARPQPSISPRLSHGLKREWPRLGPFDISLCWGDLEVFGELKCGEDDHTLSACGWDAAKQVFCLQHGVGAGMLLVAAAPTAMWDAGGLGIELFADGEWDMADIRVRYADGFRTWERDGYKPVYVFRRLRTIAVGRTEPFDIGGTPWRIGIARVEPVDEERMDWVPFVGR
jgi:hypothetical protein